MREIRRSGVGAFRKWNNMSLKKSNTYVHDFYGKRKLFNGVNN